MNIAPDINMLKSKAFRTASICRTNPICIPPLCRFRFRSSIWNTPKIPDILFYALRKELLVASVHVCRGLEPGTRKRHGQVNAVTGVNFSQKQHGSKSRSMSSSVRKIWPQSQYGCYTSQRKMHDYLRTGTGGMAKRRVGPADEGVGETPA